MEIYKISTDELISILQERTKKLKAAGELIDIPLLDHVIIAGTESYSFADQGYDLL